MKLKSEDRNGGTELTRRSFVWQNALAAGALHTGSRAFSATTPVSRATPLGEFSYSQVQFADGPAKLQFEQNRQLLLNLSEDSLLRPFRLREGLPAPGVSLGGWYAAEAFAPGCTFGQWLSSLARMYAATSDPATRDRLNQLIHGYAATIDPTGKFYVHNRFPAYVYDKLVCGLTDAHALAASPASLATLSRTTQAALRHLPDRAYARQETPVLHGEDFTRHCWDESYTLPENLFLAWQRTGERQYLHLAIRYLLDAGFFDPLAQNENVLPGLHAYSHVNALSSAAAAYLSLKSEKHLAAAVNGFRMVQEQSYATGGWGPDEHFVIPSSGKLGDSLQTTHSSFETPCGAYAHFKITRYLLRITRDPLYGDSMERVFYNTVLGARPIQPDGHAFYYSDYNFAASKFYHPDKWPCCSGTLPQISADYLISTCFRDSNGVYVNLFVPSTVRGIQSGAAYRLTVTTEYPYEDNIRFRFALSKPAAFSLFLRVPAWANGARLATNGLRGDQELKPGTFAEIRREWQDGDQIDLTLPRSNALVAIDAQNPDAIALLCGPLALARILSGNGPALTRTDLLSVRQTSSKPTVWTIPGRQERFLSFPEITDERYTIYTRV